MAASIARGAVRGTRRTRGWRRRMRDARTGRRRRRGCHLARETGIPYCVDQLSMEAPPPTSTRPDPVDEPPLSRIVGAGPGPYHRAPAPEVHLGGSGRPGWQRAMLLLAGLGLFVTALGLMKDGARSLIQAPEGSVDRKSTRLN